MGWRWRQSGLGLEPDHGSQGDDRQAHQTQSQPAVARISLFSIITTEPMSSVSTSADHLVMVANNADDPPFASIISTETYKVVAQIAFDGSNNAPKSNNGAEQCQWSPRTGKFYISIPGIDGHPKGEGGVAVIDPKTKKVVNTFIIPVDDCAAPQGMAVGPSSQILLGCNGQFPDGQANTVIINEHSGAIIRTLRGLGGNDEVWFNPGDGHYFLAEGQLPVPPDGPGTEQLGIVDSAGKRPDEARVTANNPGGTTRRAHSVAADPNANEVYVPIPAEHDGVQQHPLFRSNKRLCRDFRDGAERRPPEGRSGTRPG